MVILCTATFEIIFNFATIHSLHEFSREHYSEQNSSALVNVWRVVIEKFVTLVRTKKLSFGHCVACCY